MAHVPCPRALREYGLRRRLILLWQTNLRCLPVIPLEREVRRSHAEPTSGDLLKVVVTRLDPELHRVEWIGEANRDTHVIAVELLAQRDVRHLNLREFPFLDLHRSAIEVIRLENHRRTELRCRVQTIRPGNRVGPQRRLRSTVGDDLEDVQTTDRI